MYTSIYLHGCMYVFMYAYTCLRIHVCKFIYTNSRHLSANNARKRKPIASKSQRKSINRSVWREARGRRCTCKRFCVRDRYEWGGVTSGRYVSSYGDNRHLSDALLPCLWDGLLSVYLFDPWLHCGWLCCCHLCERAMSDVSMEGGGKKHTHRDSTSFLYILGDTHGTGKHSCGVNVIVLVMMSSIFKWDMGEFLNWYSH